MVPSVHMVAHNHPHPYSRGPDAFSDLSEYCTYAVPRHTLRQNNTQTNPKKKIYSERSQLGRPRLSTYMLRVEVLLQGSMLYVLYLLVKKFQAFKVKSLQFYLKELQL